MNSIDRLIADKAAGFCVRLSHPELFERLETATTEREKRKIKRKLKRLRRAKFKKIKKRWHV